MTDAAALWYLAYRQAVNTVRRTLKQPARVVLWALATLWFAGVIALRIVSSRFSLGHAVDFSAFMANGIFFGFVALLALNAAIAAAGTAAGFSCEADARFLTLSQIPTRRMLAWLQLRASLSLLLRLALLIAFYALLFPWLGKPVPMLLSLAGAGLAIAAIRLPSFRAALRYGRAAVLVPAAVVGLAALAGVVIMTLPSIDASFAPLARSVVHVGLGHFPRTAFAAVSWPTLVLWILGSGLLVAGYFGNTDIVPEVYAASQRAMAIAARRRRGIGVRTADRDRYALRPRAVSVEGRRGKETGWNGASALLWKDWLTFCRSRLGLIRLAVLAVLAPVAGALAGRWALGSHHPVERAAVLALEAVYLLVFFVSIYASVDLAADLGKPIWWLAADPLAKRLTAWIFASTWRISVICSLAVVACAVVIGDAAFALAGVAAAFGVNIFLRCIGLALYAMFPSQIDQRGPATMVRILLAFVFIIPVAAAGTATAIFFRAPLGVGAAALVAAGECVALVAFATARIALNGIGVARAEAT